MSRSLRVPRIAKISTFEGSGCCADILMSWCVVTMLSNVMRLWARGFIPGCRRSEPHILKNALVVRVVLNSSSAPSSKNTTH